MKYSKILNYLQNLYNNNKFNLALHTTKKENANSILDKGIIELGCRTIEGTIKFVGDVKTNVDEQTLNFFFADTNITMLVALPKFLDTIPTRESFGGNYTTCDFSRFLDLLVLYKCRRKDIDKTLLDKFTYKGFKAIPTDMIIGFYDKDENFYLNKKCYLFNDDKTLLNLLKTEYTKNKNKITENVFDDGFIL